MRNVMISVIIPVYNVENFIGLCLQSFDKQTYKDFEVIIINDGSTDNSLKEINYFKEKGKINISVINQVNQGVSKARNVGIENAQGEYLCFVDSDDMVDSHYLENMIQAIQQSECEVCICKSKLIEENCTSLDEHVNQDYVRVIKTKYETLELLLYGKIKAGIWSLLINNKVINKLRFAEGYRYSEDLEMVWKIILSCQNVVIIDAPLYCYRLRNGSAMSRVDCRRLDGMKLFDKISAVIAVEAPEFTNIYNKYGVARWVWATLWQEALASHSFSEFQERATKYDPNLYLHRLKNFPVLKVKFSSKLYLLSPKCYYWAVKLVGKKYRKLT
jgi:glycosyltransferase involved in cell wall biosynthesis